MLALGVLPGLLITAALSLILVIKHLSRPRIEVLGQDPLRLRVDGGLFYANSQAVKDRVLELAAGQDEVVLNLGSSWDLDVEAADMLTELRAALPGLRFEKLRPAAAKRLSAQSSDGSEEASPVAR